MKTEHTSNLEYYPHIPLKGEKEWIVGVPNQPGTNLFKATATCFHEPDARLYAAAPELLEFAKEMESYLELKLLGFRREYSEEHCVVVTAVKYLFQCRAAIAKATGGTI